MSFRKFQVYFFLSLLVASGILTLALFRQYFTLIAFGGVLAIISNPLFKKLVERLRSRVLAALITIFVLCMVVLVPVGYFLGALSMELISVASSIRDLFTTSSVPQFLAGVLPASFHDQIPVVMEESAQLARGLVESISQNIFGLFSNLFGVFFGFAVVLISTYYMLKDGTRIKQEVLALSPLGDEHDELVFQRIFTAVEAVMGGVLVVGVIKGVIAGFAFWLLGVPAPIFWGLLTGIAALIPLLGSSLITVPAALYLLLIGNVTGAVILFVISILIIGTVDNLLQPKLVESRTNIHPLLILLSILGGLEFYGFSGFVLGPLTLAVTMALIDIYKKEFRNYVEESVS